MATAPLGQAVTGVLGNTIVVGTESSATSLTLATGVAPAAPSAGWTLYVDSGDSNKLKAIAADGTIVTLATP